MLMVLISSIVSAIIVSSRYNSVSTSGVSYELLNLGTGYGTAIYSRIAGLQFAGYLVTFGIAAICGLICGFIVNCYN